MDIRSEVVTVLLGILAMSAPPVLFILLFRVLMKDGFPLESQKFRLTGLIVSLCWLVILLPTPLAIFFGGAAAMPDRLRAAATTFAVILILVLSWLLLILILRSKLWVKLPDFRKAFPLHFFFLVYMSCAVLLLYHFFRKYFERGGWGNDSSVGAGILADWGGAYDLLLTLITPTELSMDIRFEFVGTVLLAILAMSVPPALSTVLFRVLVKEGVPLDSQKFRHNHCVLSLIIWPMMLLPGLYAILIGVPAATPDRLRAASISCAVILLLVVSWFFLLLVFRRKLWAKRPDFTKAFPRHFFYLFHLIPLSWSVLLVYHFRKYVEKVFG